jgi:hypothetical protein
MLAEEMGVSSFRFVLVTGSRYKNVGKFRQIDYCSIKLRAIHFFKWDFNWVP